MSEELTVTQQNGAEMPALASLEAGLAESSMLINDIVLKKYLYNLTDLKVMPLADEFKKISDMHLFKINEMVYQKDEYATHKFATVFNALQHLNCAVFVIADSNGRKTDFYMGVRSFEPDNIRTTSSLKSALENTLCGQFPGVKTENIIEKDAEQLLKKISYIEAADDARDRCRSLASVSCIADSRDEDSKDNASFIQGLEKLALAMQGKKYTAIVLASSMPVEQLEATRRAYETIYTQLSPFANLQLSYGTNEALSVSNALSHGTMTGTSHSNSSSSSRGTSHTVGHSDSVSKGTTKTVGMSGSTMQSSTISAAIRAGTKFFGAQISVAKTVAQTLGLNASYSQTTTKTHTDTVSDTVSETQTVGETSTESKSITDTRTKTRGTTSGTSQNMQLTMQNRTLLDTLDRIDKQLKRIEECESLGMWKTAAYFLADNQETAEMAAGTYKALMRGSNSGLETSAINFWGHNDEKLPLLRDYVTNFIHPQFAYVSASGSLPVSPASLVSGNELAVQMGLPRKSVCGFPVVEHAEFGKEALTYGGRKAKREIILGNVFSMGSKLKTEVRLDADSLAMHTFITGSTGSGKSNAVYEILNQLRKVHNVPFLVVEPAKGEYKNVFGCYSNVSVYGTNPKKSQLLKINPFRFPEDVHVLEHLDRLVEIFNVCWPMYAAMPAIFKEAMERAYKSVGWNLETSENEKRNGRYPNFKDLLEQIENVINESKYSADCKGDYTGALLTRVRSLTNGLNGRIFCDDSIPDEELFDKNVIVDLSRVGSVETKSLIMGLLVMKLNEYRMSCGRSNSELAHITVLEEAHNLLKRTSTEQSSETANLLGKSVELLANSIAEMRTYGEGFIIADQAPGLLDMSVIRNTNTKIILRLPDKSDRELAGYAAGLKEEQIDELAKLKCGVAAVYQNDWVEPVLVQIEKCGIEEKQYCFSGGTVEDRGDIRHQIVNFLIAGRMTEKLRYSVADIECGLDDLALVSRDREFVEDMLAEFKSTGKLSVWKKENFKKLAQHIVDILDVREKVNFCFSNADSDYELATQNLYSMLQQELRNASQRVIVVLAQCLVKDMCISMEKGKDFYAAWRKLIKKKRGESYERICK